jgi:hypothetical protein
VKRSIKMSRFAYITEDPDYEAWDDSEYQSAVKEFQDWSPEAKQHLVDDLNDPWKFTTV